MAVSPSVQINVTGGRGASAGDIARRTGSFIGTPVTPGMTDQQILDAPFSAFAELVEAAGVTNQLADVKTTSTANVTLTGEQTIGNVAVEAGDRVLLAFQSSPAENGPWVVNVGAWTRPTDFDGPGEAVSGTLVQALEGVNAGLWRLTTQGTITIGTTPQTWQAFSLRSAEKIVANGGASVQYELDQQNARGLAEVTPQMFGTVTPGVDCLAQLNQARAVLVALGGGTLKLPTIGGAGYYVSNTFSITTSNIDVQLGDNFTLTKTTKAPAIEFRGVFGAPITNVSLTGIGPMRKVDGNARNMTGYTYSTADTYYSAVHFLWVRVGSCANIYGYNGLVNCIRGFQCADILFENCKASHARYDNGITIDLDPTDVTYSISDPSTWANSKMRNIETWANQSFGATNYSATNIIMENITAYDNGDDTNTPNVAEGGGISVEHDPTAVAVTGETDAIYRNHHTQIINCTVVGNKNNALWITASGTEVIGGTFDKTIAPITRPNPLDLYGYNIAIVAGGGLKVSKATVSNAEGGGIHLLAAAGGIPALDFDGKVLNNNGPGIKAMGVLYVTTSDTTLISGNGGTGEHGVDVSNSGGSDFNQALGYVRLRGSIEDSGDQAVLIDYVQDVDVSSLNTKNNPSPVVIDIKNARMALANGVTSFDTGATNVYIVRINNTVTYGAAIGVVGSRLVAAVLNNATTVWT